MTYFFICLCEGSEATKQTPGRVAKKIRHSERSEESHRRTDGYIFFALVVGYFADAQYDVLFIPYRHFVPLRLRGGRAPFVAIATFPPFQRGNLPRRRKRGLFFVIAREAKRRSKLPGGWRSTEYKFRTFSMGLPQSLRSFAMTVRDSSVGYFACARYDEK